MVQGNVAQSCTALQIGTVVVGLQGDTGIFTDSPQQSGGQPVGGVALSGIEFEIGMLDDFGEYNLSIFKSEEHEFETNKAYSILSCLSCALIDLGIIVMDE